MASLFRCDSFCRSEPGERAIEFLSLAESSDYATRMSSGERFQRVKLVVARSNTTAITTRNASSKADRDFVKNRVEDDEKTITTNSVGFYPGSIPSGSKPPSSSRKYLRVLSFRILNKDGDR